MAPAGSKIPAGAIINNVKHHKQLPVYGDGMQIRDWLYVEDHCKAIDMVANGGKVGEVQPQGVAHYAEAGQAHGRRAEHGVQGQAEGNEHTRSQRDAEQIGRASCRERV